MTDYPFDLGTYSWKITTNSEAAQIWFDRGLNWIYGYNHDEAGTCFRKALEHDPTCAMAHWGIAYMIGPNYNKPWELFDEVDLARTLEMSRSANAKAREMAVNASPAERAVIEALDARYPSDDPVPDLYIWSDGYADAMREVHRQFPEDKDITTLFVEAMMNRTPWQMWDPRSGEPNPKANTLECREILEAAIQRVRDRGEPHHPGLWHMYIHLMEMSPVPEVALRVSDELRNLVPDSGHLKHMATHIDVLCGDYYNVVAWNHEGIIADEAYWEHAGAMNFYSMYRLHNYHFKIFGAMLLGQYEPAMDAVEAMVKTIPEEFIKQEQPPMADWGEAFFSMKTHVYVRFGKWQELLDMPLPEDQALYAMTTAMTHYGKGVAHAVLGQVAEAEREQVLFHAAIERVPETRHLHVVNCLDILAVGREMLAGELEYRKRNYDVAFAHLRKAVELEDSLPYDEPWGWMQPSRHALGALLLEQGHVEEAAAAYRADLGLDDTVLRSNRHPRNVWALKGLHECYEAMGDTDKAAMIKPELDFAIARSDLSIAASCFCAKKAGAKDAA